VADVALGYGRAATINIVESTETLSAIDASATDVPEPTQLRDEESIDNVDRSSNSGAGQVLSVEEYAELRKARALEALDAGRALESEGVPESLASTSPGIAPEAPTNAGQEEREDDTPRQPSLAAIKEWLDAQNSMAEEAFEPTLGYGKSRALHAGLDLVSKRRLQMIEAMATFGSEDSAALELRPQRKIDAKTYELLTAVEPMRFSA